MPMSANHCLNRSGARNFGRCSGATRFGPANDTGLARFDQLGSVRMLTPSSCTSRVAWPTHVTVAAPRLSRMAGRSLAIDGKLAVRGENVAAKMRETKNVKRVQAPAGSDEGFMLANPFSRWWAGAPATGAPTAAQPL